MEIFKLLTAFLWIVWVIYWLVSAVKSKRSIRGSNWRLEAGLRIMILLIVILFLRIPSLYQFVKYIYLQSFYSNPLINGIGFLIFLCGFFISIWARIILAKNWGMPMTLKEKPELVTTGPYAYVRHPIYLGMIIAMVGTTIVINIFWFIPLIIISAYFVYSLKIEEKNMLQQFPKEYKEYKKQTKALIPFIY
jgi:protein-S-isoprenylcysteine O-methyltransferase Ste14